MSNNSSKGYKRAIEVSLKFCSYRERSEKELEKKLIDKKFADKTIKSSISKIIELGFVDNLRFSKFFARGKNKNNRWGKIKIRHELFRKGLSEREIEEGLNSIDSEIYKESIDKNIKLFKKKVKKFHKNKLIAHLTRKGFEMDIILSSI